MIFSDRQYAVPKEQLGKLRDALSAASADVQKHRRLREIEAKALNSQVADIERELADMIFSSQVLSASRRASPGDLPRILIQARIAKSLSQTDLAERLGMKAQQIERYEATEYMSASLRGSLRLRTP